MSADKFPFFESYYESLKDIPAEDFKAIVCAVCEHAFRDGSGEDLEGYQRAIYTLIVPTLDKSLKLAVDRREAGKAGGAPTGNNNAKQADETSKNNQKQAKTSKNNQNQTNDEQKQADKDKEIGNRIKDKAIGLQEKEKENTLPPTGEKKEARTRFTPPSVSEVRDYCRERGNNVDAEAFVDFYASKGWKIGKEPMKDWRAAVRTWERRDSSLAGSARDRPQTYTEAVNNRLDVVKGWLQEDKDG